MPTVRLAFSPAARYVRTARLVSVAVARRAGVAEELLDEVRQAVGEACGRAVARHRRRGVTELVQVEMSDDGPYLVRVVDAGGSGATPAGGEDTPAGGEDGRGRQEQAPEDGQDPEEARDADRMAEALLAGLVSELEVRPHPTGTEIRMIWPTGR